MRLEYPIQLKVRIVGGTLDVDYPTFVAGFGFDHVHRCRPSQRGWRRGRLDRWRA